MWNSVRVLLYLTEKLRNGKIRPSGQVPQDIGAAAAATLTTGEDSSSTGGQTQQQLMTDAIL